jgi:hypothetical protein
MHATEKTYKPIAFFHPFIIWGQKGILNHLHNQGFESFTNLFNEDYDNRVSIDNRLKIIIDNIKFFNKVPYDSITLDKLQHNHSLFFNTELIKQRIFDEIVNPILEWVETKQ